jgi:hypothetical protein
LLFLLLLCQLAAMGAGTVAVSASPIGSGTTWMVVVNWAGDSANGAVPSATVRLDQWQIAGYQAATVEIAPGSPAPTNGYSLTIADSSGVDMLGGAASSLSSSAPQAFSPTTTAPPLDTFTVKISGQSVASARGTLYIFLTKPSSASLGAGGVPLARIAQSGAAVNQFPQWNGTQWVPVTVGTGATIPSVTNLIKGSGTGNGADTKVAVTSPATAATLVFGTDNATITFPGTGTLLLNSRAVNTTAPLGGGGPLSGDLTLTCATCVTNSRIVNTTAPLGGGGPLSGDLTLTCATCGLAAAPVTTTFSATPTFTCPNATAGTIVNFALSTAMSANITSATLTGCTPGAMLSFSIQQAAAGGPYTVTWPTGFAQACQIGDTPSSITNMIGTWDGTNFQLGAPCHVSSGPSISSEQAAPAGTPASGSQWMWSDSTQHACRSKDASGNFYACAKELAAGSLRKAGGANTVDSAAVASDIVALFSTCSGTQYLGADGACHNAASGGAVTGEGWYPAAGSIINGGNAASIWGNNASCCSPSNLIGEAWGVRLNQGGAGQTEFPVYLPATWGGVFTVKVFHTIRADSTGSGSMTLNVQTFCINQGTTPLNGNFTYNAASTITETFTSGTTQATGFFGANELVSPATTGCAAGNEMRVKITRAAGGTSADDSIIFGAYVTLH